MLGLLDLMRKVQILDTIYTYRELIKPIIHINSGSLPGMIIT